MKTRFLYILILLNSIAAITAQDKTDSMKPEKIFLHTDRNNYAAGDNLFYALYLQGNAGQMSKYAYLILRDRKNSHVTDLRIEISNGSAFGNIYLSDTLNSGIYQLVCYTNCMRNYPEESYFNKEIVIVNRFDETIDLIAESESQEHSLSSPENNSLTKISGEKLIISTDKQVYSPRDKISFSVQRNRFA